MAAVSTNTSNARRARTIAPWSWKAGKKEGSRCGVPGPIGTEVNTHLHSAARALEQILREMHPEYDWVVRIREVEASDGQRDPATPVRLNESDPVLDDADAIAEGHSLPASDRSDDHAFDEAA